LQWDLLAENSLDARMKLHCFELPPRCDKLLAAVCRRSPQDDPDAKRANDWEEEKRDEYGDNAKKLQMYFGFY
jgi:hypothetical protein